MTLPALSTAPTAPSRADTPDDFIAKADAFVSWMHGFPTEMNSLSDAIAALAASLGSSDADAELAAIAGLVSAADRLPYFTGSGTAALATFTAFARTLVAGADAAAVRSLLALGALAIKGSVNNGDWSGTDLSVANGGTGASTASAARSNFGIDPTGDGGLVPPGAILPFGMSTAPSGWLECDGSAVSRSTYAALFSAVGTVHGTGNGTTTFNLPDLRGEFIRGYDHGRGVDSGRSFGSSQTDAFQGHQHQTPLNINFSGTGIPSLEDGSSTSNFNYPSTAIITDGTNGTPRTAAETRPVNVALLYCIKT